MRGGMIGIASGDQLRFSQFVTSIMGLQKPPDWVFAQAIGHSVAINWNNLAKQFLEYPEHLKWLFLTEDDNLLPKDALLRLLAHDKDIVSGLYVQRLIPFAPVMFDRIDKSGKVFHRFLKKGDCGLKEVAVCSGGCLLIKRHVLETIGAPYWYYGDSIYVDACNHDINFSRKATRAGFQLWNDLDVIVDHLMTFPIRPYRDTEGNWHTRIVQSDDKFIQVDAAIQDT